MSDRQTQVTELAALRKQLVDYIKRTIGNRVIEVSVGSELYLLREGGLYDATYTNYRRLTWDVVDWTRLGCIARHLQDTSVDDPLYLHDVAAAPAVR